MYFINGICEKKNAQIEIINEKWATNIWMIRFKNRIINFRAYRILCGVQTRHLKHHQLPTVGRVRRWQFLRFRRMIFASYQLNIHFSHLVTMRFCSVPFHSFVRCSLHLFRSVKSMCVKSFSTPIYTNLGIQTYIIRCFFFFHFLHLLNNTNTTLTFGWIKATHQGKHWMSGEQRERSNQNEQKKRHRVKQIRIILISHLIFRFGQTITQNISRCAFIYFYFF